MTGDRASEIARFAKHHVTAAVDKLLQRIIDDHSDTGLPVKEEALLIARQVAEALADNVIGDKIIFVDTGYWRRPSTDIVDEDDDEEPPTKRARKRTD